MKPYGTLSYAVRPESRRGRPECVWIVKGAKPVMYLNRLIAHTYGMRRDECELSDTLSNAHVLEMINHSFPLEVDSSASEIWAKRLGDVQHSRELRETLQILAPAEPTKSFVGSLKEFQKLGLDFMLKTDGCCLLADEMGLGKGYTAVAYLATAKEAFPTLIVAPLVVLKHWERELNRLLRIDNKPPIVKTIRSGKPADLRTPTLLSRGLPDVFLINYDLLAKRHEDLEQLPIQTVILDEVQALRNTGTQRYHGALELLGEGRIKHIMGLSGTPIHNNTGELWSVANLIRPGMLGTWSEFLSQHCTVDWKGRAHAINPQGLYELLREDFLLRRRIVEVLSEMPPKLRLKEHIEADLELYKSELAKIFVELDNRLQGAKTEFEKAAIQQQAVTQERQVAAMCKVEHVVKWVKACMESEEPVVVYFHHHLIKEAFDRYLREFKPCTIIGGQSDLERDNEIQRFQHGESKLMLASIRAGSLGINLTASAIVIFAELDWTPAIHKQAEGRLHRIGQDQRVLAYYLIADGTLDEIVANVLVDKTEEISALFGDIPEGENTPEAIRAFDALRQHPAFGAVPAVKESFGMVA